MNKSILFLIFSALTFQAQAHCPLEFPSVNLCAEINWLSGPYSDSESHFQLTFWEKGDKNLVPVSPKRNVVIDTFMNMGKHGHPGGIPFTYTEVEPGVIESKDVKFYSMGTDNESWDLVIELVEFKSTTDKVHAPVGELSSINGDSEDSNGEGGHHHHGHH